KMYRIIDFKRDKENIPGVIKSVEYDPNRSARIALVAYKDGEKRYIIAPHGIQVGQEVLAGRGISPDLGNTLYLSEIPFGTIIHNIELRPGQGAKIARGAGTYAQLLSRDGKYANIKMPSGEIRMILTECKATIGMASNIDHNLNVSGKAGRTRWLGRRPRVRGVVMNPVDHPMGGGEGRSSGGHPRSRKGLPAKGYRTRDAKKSSNKYIVERRKTKR
ncbi:MAG: 50S ribosomal protein L2, partial [Bacteroidales bacterium]|nr:50S ribosomal protein L2 [Bacteroidales bacterium]